MSDARHTPPGDRSFAASVVRHLAAGAVLIAVVALAFWGIGRFRVPSADGPVISAPTETTDAPTEPDEGTPGATAPATDPIAEPTSPAPSPTGHQTDPPPPGAGDRSSISVQVLDATGGDTAKMQAVVDRLRELGYQVVATNRAVRTYERSTLFFTDGHRDDALTVRGDLPELGVVDEKPSNLSDSVDVHVIVGEDYPES